MALIASGCATQVQCTVETTGVEHSTQLREALGDAGCAPGSAGPPGRPSRLSHGLPSNTMALISLGLWVWAERFATVWQTVERLPEPIAKSVLQPRS